jgi:hypothetical protein
MKQKALHFAHECKGEWEDNTTIDINIGGGRLGLIELDLDRAEKRAFLSTVINFHVP